MAKVKDANAAEGFVGTKKWWEDNRMTSGAVGDIVARTMYGEARGEGPDGIVAVGCVIRNRVKDPRGRFTRRSPGSRSLQDTSAWRIVCRAPRQFSCWNEEDLNFRVVLEAYGDDFHDCQTLALAIMNDEIEDTTCGATHYHTRNVHPKWAEGHTPCAVIGNHLFYNDVD